jgi:hypothetical protein
VPFLFLIPLFQLDSSNGRSASSDRPLTGIRSAPRRRSHPPAVHAFLRASRHEPPTNTPPATCVGSSGKQTASASRSRTSTTAQGGNFDKLEATAAACRSMIIVDARKPTRRKPTCTADVCYANTDLSSFLGKIRGHAYHFHKLRDIMYSTKEMNSALPASLGRPEQSCKVYCPTSKRAVRNQNCMEFDKNS